MHGKINDKVYSTIDYLEQKGKLYENIRDNLFSPLLLSEIFWQSGNETIFIKNLFTGEDIQNIIDKCNKKDIFHIRFKTENRKIDAQNMGKLFHYYYKKENNLTESDSELSQNNYGSSKNDYGSSKNDLQENIFQDFSTILFSENNIPPKKLHKLLFVYKFLKKNKKLRNKIEKNHQLKVTLNLFLNN